MNRPIERALGLLLVLAAGGCTAATGSADQCQVGADCASGACQAGRCVGGSGGNAGNGGAAGASGGAAGAAGQSGAAGAAAAAGAAGAAAGGSSGAGGSAGANGSCLPNNDGVIERAEVPLAAGLDAKFLTAENAPVDTAGAAQADGSRNWNLAGSLSGDHLALVATQALAGQWFQSSFAGASYSAKLSDTQPLLGVFQITSSSLLLQGVVSPSGGATRTELKYAPATTVLSFPLSMGKSWTTTSNVTGVAQGVLANYTEKYDYAVDAHGMLATPFGSFPVLRTRVVLTRTVGLLKTTLRTYLFTTECFGTVASIVSKDNEPNAEFTTAAEVQRLSP